MGLLYTVIALVPLLWMASNAWALYRNYRAARVSGLPILICPFDPDNVFYIIVSVPLRPVFERFLPKALYDVIKITIFGWEFRDKHDIHDRVGPAFMLVTPAMNQLLCADPAMAQVILARRKDFVQSPIASTVMKFLGENVITADGESWSRQRRIVASSLNERISEGVWKESTEQANQMANFMLGMPKGESCDAIEGLRAIAINVLGQVAYGQSKRFGPMKLPTDPTSSMSYIEAISLCTAQLVVAALIPAKFLRLSVLPKILQTVGAALHNLPGLTKNMLDQERQRAASGVVASNNIMGMLVRLSDQEKGKGPDELQGRAYQYLTEDEIAGNLFVFTAAGFDTTANTMAYALTLLAAYPKWQLWIQDELDFVLSAQQGSDVAEYSATFPKLTRCLALMFETLRLFPPVMHIARSIQTTQSIAANDRTYDIGGPCTVYVNSACLQTYPSIWGEDSTSFNPSRWLTPGCTIGNSQLITPERGTFLPWSGGPRVCPGQKMSQVEFVATVATLFRICRVEPVAKPGENIEQAREKLVNLMQDSQPRLTLQMNRPKEVHLRWLRR